MLIFEILWKFPGKPTKYVYIKIIFHMNEFKKYTMYYCFHFISKAYILYYVRENLRIIASDSTKPE